MCSLFWFIGHPLSCVPWLHGRYPLRSYYGRSDSRRAALRVHDPGRRFAPAGLPDYRGQTSGHSVSNHRRNDRGLTRLSGDSARAYRPLYRLRQSLEGSPIHADRIEFTCLCISRLCYGLVVLVPLLSTPCCHDAVTVRYPTALRRRGTDFHRSVFPPSQAHERRRRAAFNEDKRMATPNKSKI